MATSHGKHYGEWTKRPEAFWRELYKNNRHRVHRFLADQPESAKWKNTDGVSALSICCERGFEGICEDLIMAGADINEECENDSKDFPLLIACRHGFVQIVEMLLVHGVKVNARRKTDLKTALHEAAFCGFSEIVKLLLEHNAEMDCETINAGETPLALAVKQGRIGSSKVLISAGANKTKGNPLKIAQDSKNTELIQLLHQ